MATRKTNTPVTKLLPEPELRQRLESRFKEADPALFQQTNDFIEDLKAQLKAIWLEKKEHQEAADRWRKQFEQTATAHDERVKDNAELKEKSVTLKGQLKDLKDALGAEDLERWEDVLLLARGKYYNRGEESISLDSLQYQLLESQDRILDLLFLLKEVVNLPGFEPKEPYGKKVLDMIRKHQLPYIFKTPKKLIRDQVVAFLKPGESEQITDQVELNKLYVLKVKEELIEIIQSGFKDIKEFADLVQVALTFAKVNGFAPAEVREVMQDKILSKGNFSNIALNNLNPNNPSNYLYFKPTNL